MIFCSPYSSQPLAHKEKAPDNQGLFGRTV